MDHATINTTERYGQYCREVAKDGRTCALYSPHEGKHKARHGLESDRWDDGE